MSPVSAAFLDRDGTLNVKAPEGEYVTTPDELVLIPGAADAVARLNRAGVPVFVVTNQRGVALGRMSEVDLAAVHARLVLELARGDAHLDGIYACLHHAGACRCRKPLPGLLEQAAVEHPALELPRAVLIGDAASDVAAGHAVGATTVRLTPHPHPSDEPVPADHHCPDLAAAVTWVLSELG